MSDEVIDEVGWGAYWSRASMTSPRTIALSAETEIVMATLDRSGLGKFADTELEVLFRHAERVDRESAWFGHVPFASWLVHAARPQILVELGTHSGVSYAAFCQAVEAEKLGTRCYAVDTWTGDKHSGFYSEEVFRDLHEFHGRRYSAFSQMLRCTFDEARSTFADGCIDVLHVDGLHTYEAVKADFEAWLPKLSSRSVVLFHDTNERQGDFGVWRLWAEVSAGRPAFEFLHGHGLGVLCVGAEVPDAVRALCSLPEESVALLRARFARLGERWEFEARAIAIGRELKARDARIADLDTARATVHASLQSAEAERVALIARAEAAERAVAEAQASLRAAQMARANTAVLSAKVAQAAQRTAEAAADEARIARAALRYEWEEYQRQSAINLSLLNAATAKAAEAVRTRDTVLNSTAWKLTWPFRLLVGALPASVRRQGRRATKAAWWAASTSLGLPRQLLQLGERHRSVGPPAPPDGILRDRVGDDSVVGVSDRSDQGVSTDDSDDRLDKRIRG